MLNKKKLDNYNVYLNPHARVLLQEYNKALKNKMWSTAIILSLTIIDNILSDDNSLYFPDGLDVNNFKRSKDFHWLRIRRNEILHYEKPIEGFMGNKDGEQVLKSDATRANDILTNCFYKFFKNL